MSTIEERLREALHDKARDYEAHPQARARIRRRVRRRRARLAAAGGALAAIAVAGASVPAVLDRGADDREAAARPSGDTAYQGPRTIRELYPPTSEMVRSEPIGGRAKPTDVWFSDLNGTPALCWSWTGEPVEGGCASPLSPRAEDDFTARFGEDLGGPPIGGQMALGVAGPDVASVTAVLGDGREVTGRLLHGEGFRYPVWQVGGTHTVESVTLKDAGGRALGTVEQPDADTGRGCALPERPPGAAVDLPGSDLAAHWDGSCLGFWAGGKAVKGFEPDGPLAEAARRDGGRRWAEGYERWAEGRRWWGIAGPETRRVEFELHSGVRVEARTVVPDWNQRVALFGGAVPPEHGPEGTLTGYGADGTALWHRNYF
ncbi:hypothetical protein [Actinomadura sediminis]|uniref:Uncharacterized protein n=1 Tax=Actinomadura sediminis TaxID=1038904 RepID=A0ABW3EFC1_9ACTN